MEGNTQNTSNNLKKAESTIDFSAIFTRYKRYWWLFAASVAVCLCFSIFYLYVKKPIFLIQSKVLITQSDDGANFGASLMKSFSLGPTGADVNDEIIVMGAQSIRMEMIKKLKLNRTYVDKSRFMKSREYYNNSPIEINAPDALFDTLSVALKFNIEVNENGDKIEIAVKKGLFKTLAEVEANKFPVTVKTEYGIYSIDKTKFYKPGKDIKIKAMVMGNQVKSETYNDELTVELVSKKSSGLNLYLGETNTERGKDILNTIVELYNQRGQQEKDETAINTGKFIDERLNIIYAQLSESEAEIEKYKRSYNMVDLGVEAKYIYNKNKLSEEQVIKVKTELNVLEMIRDFISKPENKTSLIPFSAEFSAAQPAIEQYNENILYRHRLSVNAKGDNIALKTADEQLEILRKNVLISVNKTIESGEIRLAAIQKEASSSQGALSTIPQQEREFIELERKQVIQNELYKFLLQKKEENELVLAASTPKGKIVDLAYSSLEPIKPKKSLVIIVALFLGLLIPVIILYIKALLTNKFTTQEELEHLVSSPVIGEICKNRHRRSLVVRPGKTSSIVELFRLTRNNIQFMLPNPDDKVILVTSSISGEGKSFISTNLASSFALLGKKVVLIGLDIRSPKLAEYLNLNPTTGATNYFASQETTLNQIIQHSEIPNLDVIVSGPVPPNPSELLLVNRVSVLFEELRKHYDYIIVDSAPIGMVSDTFSLSKYSNVILYVTRSNYTNKSNIRYLNQVVSRQQLHNVAVLLNDTNPKISSSYGYGYGYGYGETKDNED